MNLDFILAYNFTDLINNTGLLEYCMRGYEIVLGFVMYPMFFSGIIGYVYVKQQSFVAAAVAIMIIIAAFADVLMRVPVFVMILRIAFALIIAMLVIVFISRMRR